VNFGTPVPLLIGIVLIVGAIALFFLDKLKPGYGRDSDKVYALLCLVSGVFLLAHLTMELIPSFQQLIMAGMVIALLIDNIRTRGPAGDRFAQPQGPDLRPDYRPSSRPGYGDRRANVRAELERDGGYYGPSRPVLGSRDQGRSAYGDDAYGDRGYDERDRWDDRRNEAPYGSSNGRNDERIRRRRPPLQLRGDIGTTTGNSYGDDYGAYPSNGGGGYSSHSGGGGYGTADYSDRPPADGTYSSSAGNSYPTTGGPSPQGDDDRARSWRGNGSYSQNDEYADYDRY
jgi:hypothetical protein